MKSNGTTQFASKVDASEYGLQRYSRREIQGYIKGMTLELRTCPKNKMNKLINIITELKAL